MGNGVRLKNSANQSINSAALTILTFDQEDFDDLGWHSGADPARIIVPAGAAGLYQFTAGVSWAPSALGIRQLRIRMNGVTNLASEERTITAAGAGEDQTLTTIWRMNVGDYVEATAYQTSGGALNSVGGTGYSPLLEAIYLGA